MIGEYPEYIVFAFLLSSVYISTKYFGTLSVSCIDINFTESGCYFFPDTIVNRFFNIYHSVIRNISRITE